MKIKSWIPSILALILFALVSVVACERYGVFGAEKAARAGADRLYVYTNKVVKDSRDPELYAPTGDALKAKLRASLRDKDGTLMLLKSENGKSVWMSDREHLQVLYENKKLNETLLQSLKGSLFFVWIVYAAIYLLLFAIIAIARKLGRQQSKLIKMLMWFFDGNDKESRFLYTSYIPLPSIARALVLIASLLWWCLLGLSTWSWDSDFVPFFWVVGFALSVIFLSQALSFAERQRK